MNYFLIFSDEFGSWSKNNGKFYIRSWLKIKRDDFYYLESFWKNEKLEEITPKTIFKKELAEKIFQNPKIDSDTLKIFFTFTKLDEFYSRRFVIKEEIIKEVSNVLLKLEQHLREYMKQKIPLKIKRAIEYVLFLHVYEFWHINNALKKFIDNQEDNYKFYFDKPQFIESDYRELFRNIFKTEYKEEDIEFIHRNNSIGIKITDALASLLGTILNNNFNNTKKEIRFFNDSVLGKSFEGNCGIFGINKVFYPAARSYGNEKLISEEKDLIYKLKTNLCLSNQKI
jgi:hypothetical protein